MYWSQLSVSCAKALCVAWGAAEVATGLEDPDTVTLKASFEAEADLYELLNDLIMLDVDDLTKALAANGSRSLLAS